MSRESKGSGIFFQPACDFTIIDKNCPGRSSCGRAMRFASKARCEQAFFPEGLCQFGYEARVLKLHAAQPNSECTRRHWSPVRSCGSGTRLIRGALEDTRDRLAGREQTPRDQNRQPRSPHARARRGLVAVAVEIYKLTPIWITNVIPKYRGVRLQAVKTGRSDLLLSKREQDWWQ